MPFMNFFQRTTCKEGLARTLAPIGAASGAGLGLKAGFAAGLILGTFALDDPKASHATAGTIIGATSLVGATLFAGTGYIGTYAVTNLGMAAFPFMQKKEIPLLVKGVKPQLGLFAASCAFFATKAVISTLATNHETNAKLTM